MDTKPLLVYYISGPYRDKRGEWYVGQNIQNARAAAIEIWKLGGVALCPHMNTAGLGGLLPDDTWLQGDLELIRRCDAVWMIDGWQKSEGAKIEMEFALELGVPVLYNLEDVKEYFRMVSDGQR